MKKKYQSNFPMQLHGSRIPCTVFNFGPFGLHLPGLGWWFFIVK